MKDFGLVKRCLGIEFYQNLKLNQVIMSQQNYAQAILECFGMTECKPVSTPVEVNCKLPRMLQKDENLMAKYPYQRLIGALMYTAVTTRPDITYAVNYMSQFNSNYSEEHWKAAKRILRCIQGTIDDGLCFIKTNEQLYGLVDADWRGNLIDRRSYTGYALMLGGAAVSWEARKQRTVALSSTETEYLAIAEEALYLKDLVNEIGISSEELKLYNDSQSAQK